MKRQQIRLLIIINVLPRCYQPNFMIFKESLKISVKKTVFYTVLTPEIQKYDNIPLIWDLLFNGVNMSQVLITALSFRKRR